MAVCTCCKKAIYQADPQLNLGGNPVHKFCAKCKECGCQLTLSNFRVDTNMDFYCSTHYQPHSIAPGRTFNTLADSVKKERTKQRTSLIQTTLPAYLSNPPKKEKTDAEIISSLLLVAEDVGVFNTKYRVQHGDIVAMGATSVVKYGNAISDNECVVIKFYGYTEMETYELQLLSNHVSHLSGLDHPNIMKLIDFYSDKTEGILVLDNVSGGSLFDRIAEKDSYSEAEAKDTAASILKAIKYLHDRDIVHRNLKPEYLFLNDDETVKVTHFGLAASAKSPTLTEQVGTLDGKAPEMLQNLPYGKGVDMWSFGINLFILLGGYHPFEIDEESFVGGGGGGGDDDYDFCIYKKILQCEELQFPDDETSMMSEDAKDLIMSLLTTNPTTRLTVDQAVDHRWFRLTDKDSSRLPEEPKGRFSVKRTKSYRIKSHTR